MSVQQLALEKMLSPTRAEDRLYSLIGSEGVPQHTCLKMKITSEKNALMPLAY